MHNENSQDWLQGGGECGALIRSIDWSKNSLGPIEQWPQSLKTAVSLCLSSTFPINIVWGPDHIQIYNDAYRPICGALHPASMSSKFKECWASALPVVGDAFDRAFHGEGTYIPNQRMFLERFGYLEESWMTFSFSPIRDESGNVGGIFHPITESTEKMLSSRRTQIIRDLAIELAKSKNLREVYAHTIRSKTAFELDIPFIAFFEKNEDGGFSVTSTENLPHNFIDPKFWDFQAIKEIKVAKSLKTNSNLGPYDAAPKEAVIMPIKTPGSEDVFLYVVAGVSVCRELDSEYLGFYEMFRNTLTTAITNVRAYEDELKRAEALAQIDRAKTAFFSNVSHEFRTPLTLIIGPLEDILNDPNEKLSVHQRKNLETVQRNSNRLLKLVNSLLDFSRIEAGRVEASFAPVNISAYTAELASIFRSTIEKEGLELEIITEPSLEIYLDKDMWEKVILNLLSNAFKFTFEGKVSVKVRASAHGVDVSVSDTGIGVEAKELPRLFERFHRVQGAKSRTYEGTGIGLALVHELIQMHGGSIRAESSPGKGTTFTISLLAGTSHLPAEKIASEKTLSSTSISASSYLQEANNWTSNEVQFSTQDKDLPVILIADDNADMRFYVAEIMKSKWQVVTAEDGFEALAIARKIKPDLILSDVMMPNLDGFGFLSHVRESAEIKDIPFVMLSARAGQEARVEGLEAGADDYLVKPFSAKELISRIESLLKSSITRKQNSAVLEENAAKFRSTFAHASVNIAMLNLEGMVLQINNAFLNKTGFSSDEVVGHHFSKVTHPDDISPNLDTVKKLIAGEIHSASFEKRYLKKDGGFFWVKTSISAALDELSKPLYLIAVSQDIESIKQTEAKYQKVVLDLENEKELRERFVATLTHDLRSPMTSAKVSAQMIQRRPDMQDAVQNQAARIVNSVNRADQMIQDLLDANQLRAGDKLPMKFEKVELNHLVLDITNNLITQFGDRFHYYGTEKALDAELSVLALGRVIDNLAQNAIKYGDPHAPVTISVGSSNDRMTISVHNEGRAMTEEELKYIFSPYKRLSNEATKSQKGWGLGLTLVKGMVENMGGAVKVTSLPVKGTTFQVSLPMNAKDFYDKL